MTGIGFCLPYLPLYLKDEKGFSDRGIALVWVLAAVAGLLQFPQKSAAIQTPVPSIPGNAAPPESVKPLRSMLAPATTGPDHQPSAISFRFRKFAWSWASVSVL